MASYSGLLLVSKSFDIYFIKTTLTPLYAAFTTHLKNADASMAISEAQATEKSFGKGSPEAIIAWETVEEIASSDQPTVKGGLDEECSAIDSAACEEYAAKMKELETLLSTQRAQLAKIKDVTSQVRAVALKANAPAVQNKIDSGMLQAAIAEAKAATAKFGKASGEAAVAWDSVEEISASDNSMAGIPMLSDECLVDAMEACEALEELERAVVVSVSVSVSVI